MSQAAGWTRQPFDPGVIQELAEILEAVAVNATLSRRHPALAEQMDRAKARVARVAWDTLALGVTAAAGPGGGTSFRELPPGSFSADELSLRHTLRGIWTLLDESAAADSPDFPAALREKVAAMRASPVARPRPLSPERVNPVKGKGGRPRTPPEAEAHQRALVREWEQSKAAGEACGLQEFCDGKGVTLDEFKRAQALVRKRRREAHKHAANKPRQR